MNNDKTTREIVALSLRDMFESRRFDICTIRDCMELTGQRPSDLQMRQWSALHCVHWTKMSRELKETIFREVLEVFSSPPEFNTDVIDLIIKQTIHPKHVLGAVQKDLPTNMEN